MSDSYQIRVGSLAYELVGGDYRHNLETALGRELAEMVEHKPDYGASVPVRLVPKNGALNMTIGIPAGNWDDVLEAIAPLKRALNGHESWAAQQTIAGQNIPVVIRIQLDGQTDYTDVPVLYGLVDDGAAYHDEAAANNKVAWRVPLVLVVAPYCEGQTQTLRNELSGSPHMLQAGSTAGLAAGLALVGSPTSYELSKTRYLLKQSQKVTVPSTGTVGIETTQVTCPQGTAAAAYAWVSHEAGNDVRVRLVDGAGNVVQSKTIGNSTGFAAADMTHTDDLGHTWYRVRLTGLNVTYPHFKLQVVRHTSEAASTTVFYADLLYLQTSDSINLFAHPQMDVDVDANGVVDGWYFSGTATSTLSTTSYFSSPKSQGIGDGAGTTKLISDLIPVNVSATRITCEAWVYPTGGTGNSTFNLYDGFENLLATVTINSSVPTGYVASQVGDDGATWFKYQLIVNNPLFPPGQGGVRAEFKGTANVLAIDDVVLYEGVYSNDLSNTKAWVSPYQIYNRFDPSTTNPTYQNTVDVWGIPGDLPARMTTRINWGTLPTSKQRFYLCRWHDGLYPAVERFHLLELAGGTTTATNGSWSTNSSSAFNGGSARRFTASGGTGSGTLTIPFRGVDSAYYYLAFLRRVFLQTKVSNVNATIAISIKAGVGTNTVELLGASGLVAATTNLQILDAGLCNASNMLYASKRNYYLDTAFSVVVSLTAVPNGATVDLDCLWMWPVDEFGEFMLFRLLDAPADVRQWIYVTSEDRAVTVRNNGMAEPYVAGSFFELEPGVANRVAMLMTEDDNDTTITDSARVSFLVTPRSSHLLGSS